LEIIINIKHISRIKNVFLQKVPLLFFVAIFLLQSSVPQAQADISPLEGLKRFSREKVVKTRKIEVENLSTPEQSLEDLLQKNDAEIFLKTPEEITDPQEIEKAVDFASSITGVRKNFIMGLLVVESDLGRNPGECTYKEVEDGAKIQHETGRLSLRAWQTFKERREIIKDVALSLGYDYEKLNVSCNPGSAYVGTGGAMGIPQFMPDTWMEYKDRISAVVGKENPDPWDERDAAVAVALKLSDVYGVTDHSRIAERNAAKLYLSGSTSSRYDWYANQIFYWAENYKNLIG